MIDYIEGKIINKGSDYLVVKTGGLGFHVTVDANTLNTVGNTGETVELFVYTSVKQQQSDVVFSLYGFKTEEDVHMFKLLLDVNGIGPKVAIDVLSSLTPEMFYDAVAKDDAKLIAKAKGVSAKKAQEIIVVLKDKVKKNIGDVTVSSDDSEPDNEVKKKTVNALVNWGCNAKDAKRVVNLLYQDGDTFDKLVRAALKALT